MRRFAVILLTLLLCSISALPAPAGATAPPAVRLSVSLPLHAYPRNALVLAVVRLRNETARAITLQGICGDNPLVEVLTPRHNIVYPTNFAYQPCPGTAPLRLGPGGSTTRHLFIVLRGSWLLPVVLLTHHRTVTGPILRLSLYSAPSPQVILHTTDPVDTNIELRPRWPVRGPLYYSDSYVCQADSNPRTIVRARIESDWHLAPDRSVLPHWPSDCPPPQEWHVVAGWLNEPVATFTYPNLG